MATKSTALLLVFCAGTLAAYSGWKLGDELFLRSAEAAFADSSPLLNESIQRSNSIAKRDRDVVAVLRSAEDVAAIAKPAESDTTVLALARIEPEPQTIVPEPVSLTEKPDVRNARAELSPQPSLQPSLKAKAVAKIEKIGRALLSDYQIAGIKQRLALTSAQQRYWPAVEKSLRGLTERVVEYRKNLRKPHGGKYDAEAAEVEDLKAAVLPLLAQLRDDQKSTVIVLANMAGLGSVVTELFSGNEVASSAN